MKGKHSAQTNQTLRRELEQERLRADRLAARYKKVLDECDRLWEELQQVIADGSPEVRALRHTLILERTSHEEQCKHAEEDHARDIEILRAFVYRNCSDPSTDFKVTEDEVANFVRIFGSMENWMANSTRAMRRNTSSVKAVKQTLKYRDMIGEGFAAAAKEAAE
jgi:hypothetical protein